MFIRIDSYVHVTGFCMNYCHIKNIKDSGLTLIISKTLNKVDNHAIHLLLYRNVAASQSDSSLLSISTKNEHIF